MTEVKKIDASLIEEFFKLHCKENGADLCNCVAWWVPTWDGWDDRTPEENRALREDLFRLGEFDGYLLFEEDAPIGWCQAFPKHRLEKLTQNFPSSFNENTFAISCFFIIPSKRNKGMARRLLQGVLSDLKLRGVQRVEAYPKQEANQPQEDAWLGPFDLFREEGFNHVADKPGSRVMMKELQD